MDEFSPDELSDREACRYEPPKFSVIALDCEITAYAPVGDDPLF
jgi:hypothetical protein